MEFLTALPRSIVRAKGIVELSDGECVLVQQTGHHRALSAIDAAPTGIVLISSE
ncbi:MAG: GTP-binding protein [Acidimicrobiaceae bacterium]